MPKKTWNDAHLIWTCADGRKMRPSEMTASHKINCMRLKARMIMRVTGLPYSIACMVACEVWPVMKEIAIQLIHEGKDPFQDHRQVLMDEDNADSDADYPMSDYVTLPEGKVKIVDCPVCGGAGVVPVPNTDIENCAACDGTGRVEAVVIDLSKHPDVKKHLDQLTQFLDSKPTAKSGVPWTEFMASLRKH